MRDRGRSSIHSDLKMMSQTQKGEDILYLGAREEEGMVAVENGPAFSRSLSSAAAVLVPCAIYAIRRELFDPVHRNLEEYMRFERKACRLVCL